MAETYLTLKESSELSQKSIQTLRRAIKAKKIRTRKQKTPQGFNYMVAKSSLVEHFSLKHEKCSGLQSIPSESPTKKSTTRTSTCSTSQAITRKAARKKAVYKELKDLEKALQKISNQYQREREGIKSVLKDFQDRLVVMENQVQMLQAPKSKWYQFWK